MDSAAGEIAKSTTLTLRSQHQLRCLYTVTVDVKAVPVVVVQVVHVAQLVVIHVEEICSNSACSNNIRSSITDNNNLE